MQHTGAVGHTDSESAQHTFDSEKKIVFLVLLTRFEPQVIDVIAILRLTLYQLNHPASLLHQ